MRKRREAGLIFFSMFPENSDERRGKLRSLGTEKVTNIARALNYDIVIILNGIPV